QNFVSAAVGIAIVAALIRGFTRKQTDRVGNFWVDLTRVVVRLLLPMVFVLALAGALAKQQPVPVTAGTLPTHRPQFVGLLSGVVVTVVGLTYFPALALGPLAEGLH
ncbi:potassium-transporting ATPase subunit KdpA, partial [Streptomyces sp.]|uniref:potassium-transporting ATPase subunit KdpA n=1 Tax=Streptomyces sp. TaxID=1931 RepID=UPI002F3EEC8F